MKLILKMTTDEIKERYGDDGGYICCYNCPCADQYGLCQILKIYHYATFALGKCDGYEVAYERIKEYTKTMAEVPPHQKRNFHIKRAKGK